MPGSIPAPATPARQNNCKPGRSCSESPSGAGATNRPPDGLGAALRAASLRGQDPELRGAGQARACQPGTSLPNHAAEHLVVESQGALGDVYGFHGTMDARP